MQKALKYLVTLVYKPILAKYLSSTRAYRYKGIRLMIPPQVFHPGFFFSTKILLKWLAKEPLKQRSFLELGAGSGLISMYASRMGAKVTATDINPIAVDYLEKNAKANAIRMTILHSDLFASIPVQTFDTVAINPPYFKKTPRSPIDHAWYCGENGEYFDRLFDGLGAYIHGGSQVLLILSDGCDMEMIDRSALRYGWELKRVLTKKNLMETLFIIQALYTPVLPRI
jgi:release factor glutamine methyltransferase